MSEIANWKRVERVEQMMARCNYAWWDIVEKAGGGSVMALEAEIAHGADMSVDVYYRLLGCFGCNILTSAKSPVESYAELSLAARFAIAECCGVVVYLRECNVPPRRLHMHAHLGSNGPKEIKLRSCTIYNLADEATRLAFHIAYGQVPPDTPTWAIGELTAHLTALQSNGYVAPSFVDEILENRIFK